MRDEPFARDLLETAREALKSDILPLLSGGDKYTGAMIANALGMAMREMDADGTDTAEISALQRLTGSGATDAKTLNANLAAAIRDGRFDPGTDGHDAMRRALMSMTVDRLALANPGALQAERDLGTIPNDFTPWQKS